MTTEMRVEFETDKNGNVSASIFMVEGAVVHCVNKLKGHAAVELYDSMTGEGLTEDDLK